MSAWLRNLGLLFIVGGGVYALRACPPPSFGSWAGVRAPLAGPQLSAEATFTAPHTATYFVQIKLPPQAKDELINTLVRPHNGTRGEPIECRIWDGEEPVRTGGYGANRYPYYDGPAHTLAAFTGEAGHTYRVQVPVGKASAAFVKARPFVEVTYNPAVEVIRHRHYGEYFWSVLCLLLGVQLTFQGGSRLPVRAWLRSTS